MKSSTIAAMVAITTSMAIASPIQKRDASSCSYASTGLNSFNIWLNQPCFTADQNWCRGYLDNLRGQCGDITNWQSSADGSGARLYFNTNDPSDFPDPCVKDAIWLASSPHIEGLTCSLTN